MSKKVLIISSSPRKGGNSDILCDVFAEGAKAAGNEVEKVRIAALKIGYCTGCYACQKTGKCAIKDDAQGVINKMMAADVIVLASPVYFYSICAQLKALIDRTVVVYPNLTNKRFYYILTMADTNRDKFDGSLAALHGIDPASCAYHLALCFLVGYGTARSPEKASQLFNRVIRNEWECPDGLECAAKFLEMIERGDFPKAPRSGRSIGSVRPKLH